MYYGMPVVVTPYEDFVADFGERIDFGLYTNGKIDNLVACLKTIMTSDYYAEICINAHRAVSDFTWDNYVADFLKILDDLA